LVSKTDWDGNDNHPTVVMMYVSYGCQPFF
jgi:hypothetical protein